MRIIINQEKRMYILENPILNAPFEDVGEEFRNEHERHVDDDEQTACVMLTIISYKIQRQHENMNAYTIIMHLKELFDETSRTNRYQTSKELFRCKMTKGSSMNTHVLKMNGYIEKLEQLGFVMDRKLSVELVLQSLPQNFSQFIMNYHMNKLDSTLPELFNMLRPCLFSGK